ncbi:MAG TPA: hypothetical protein VFA85_06770 [Terriglobales bacterium]|nr:hypothetical protein [Terriglobales bacterium]
MNGESIERWQQVCAQAAVEQDPKKLIELVAEINRLLEEKERRLQKLDPNGNATR